ncbi:hypothetical protein D9M72_545330 [compost metagenome]
MVPRPGVAFRCAWSATGRKPRKAATDSRPMAPRPAEAEPRSCATGTTSTAVTVAPVVMVTVYSAVMREVRCA